MARGDEEAGATTFTRVPCDVADFESCAARRRRRSQTEVGPIDVLVNNAGITRDMTFKKMDKADWDAVMQHQPRQRVQHDQAGDRRHGRARLGPHHQRLFGERPERRVRPDQLFGGEGRHARLHEGARARSRAQGRHRQHDLAGLYRDEDGDWRSRRTCWTPRSCRRFRSGGWASRRKSPAWWPTSLRKKPRS